MEKQNLYEKLVEYSEADFIPMHMPGAKRNENMSTMINPYKIDMTEIDGFDNMHHPQEIIKYGFEKAAELFGANRAYFLVNGSTSGILTAICGVTKKTDKILVARNCHKSVYNGIYLNELNPIYIYPYVSDDGICGEITPDSVREKLDENTEIKAVVITSPTYEGKVSDIHEIAKVVHKYKIPLIVDEAHGAHFDFNEAFPQSAQCQGADIVITSLHKTLPSLTPTALLLINEGLVDIKKIERYYDIYQTSSPSYILMASITQCLDFIETNVDAFEKYVEKLTELRKKLGKLKNIRLVTTDDISKLVLACCDGKRLYDCLRDEYHIQLEMTSKRYVIAMTSVCDKDEYYDAFANALEELDGRFAGKSGYKLPLYVEAKQAVSVSEAVNADGEEVISIDKAEGRIAKACIGIYPPGIPIINYGELFTNEIIDIIKEAWKLGFEVDQAETDTERGVSVRCLK